VDAASPPVKRPLMRFSPDDRLEKINAL